MASKGTNRYFIPRLSDLDYTSITFKVHVSGSLVPMPHQTPRQTLQAKDSILLHQSSSTASFVFLSPALKQLTDAFNDPYYVEVIEHSERELLNKDGPGSGVVASFLGRMIDMLHQGQSTIRDKDRKCREALEEYGMKTHAQR